MRKKSCTIVARFRINRKKGRMENHTFADNLAEIIKLFKKNGESGGRLCGRASEGKGASRGTSRICTYFASREGKLPSWVDASPSRPLCAWFCGGRKRPAVDWTRAFLLAARLKAAETKSCPTFFAWYRRKNNFFIRKKEKC